MAYLHLSPPPADGGYLLKIVGGMLVSAALAAGDPATVTPVADMLNVRPHTLWAALLGGVMFVLLTDGAIIRRMRRASASVILAYLSTDFVLAWLGWTAAAQERAVALAFSLLGAIVVEAILRGATRWADWIFDRAAGLAARRVGIPSPPDGGPDAPK